MLSRNLNRSLNWSTREIGRFSRESQLPMSQIFVSSYDNKHRGQTLQYSTSLRTENQLIVGGMALAASALTLRIVVTAFQNYQASKPAAPTDAPAEGDSASSPGAAEETTAKSTASEQPAQSKTKKAQDSTGAAAAKAADSMFASWFARGFYEGGFEDKMTKREAALILGIRESATVEKVKEAHRRVLLLNHPDRGGSVFLAAKINEAKDLLLKGRA